jgi:hypothetical protein
MKRGREIGPQITQIAADVTVGNEGDLRRGSVSPRRNGAEPQAKTQRLRASAGKLSHLRQSA